MFFFVDILPQGDRTEIGEKVTEKKTMTIISKFDFLLLGY